MDISPILILSLGGGLAVILLIVGIVSSVSSDKSAVEERLGQYIDPGYPRRNGAHQTHSAYGLGQCQSRNLGTRRNAFAQNRWPVLISK